MQTNSWTYDGYAEHLYNSKDSRANAEHVLLRAADGRLDPAFRIETVPNFFGKELLIWQSGSSVVHLKTWIDVFLRPLKNRIWNERGIIWDFLLEKP